MYIGRVYVLKMANLPFGVAFFVVCCACTLVSSSVHDDINDVWDTVSKYKSTLKLSTVVDCQTTCSSGPTGGY